MRIKIKSTPPGENVPEWIRAAWVGIEIESCGTADRKPQTDADILVGRKTFDGYKVNGELAFQALKSHNKEAYDWWVENYPHAAKRNLVFAVEACEKIS